MPSQTRHTSWILLLVLGCGLLAMHPFIWAAAPPVDEAGDAGQVAEEEESSTEAGQDDGADSVISLILRSGATGLLFFGVLLLFSLVGATVAIERAMSTRRSKIIPPGFVDELEQLVKQTDVNEDSFHDLCSRWTTPISNILKAGLLRCGRPLPEVEKSMEDAAAREMAELRGGIRPLNVVGTVAPLVGLLGTVVGMIIAFRTASQAGLGKGELMAQGIYMALVTTAAGLTIAIPALLLSALFNSKVEKFFREIDKHMMTTMPCFARMEQKSKSDN
jgi:biopolymer transport protein ExbB